MASHDNSNTCLEAGDAPSVLDHQKPSESQAFLKDPQRDIERIIRMLGTLRLIQQSLSDVADDMRQIRVSVLEAMGLCPLTCPNCHLVFDDSILSSKDTDGSASESSSSSSSSDSDDGLDEGRAANF